jgi:hypothetical protein
LSFLERAQKADAIELWCLRVTDRALLRETAGHAQAWRLDASCFRSAISSRACSFHYVAIMRFYGKRVNQASYANAHLPAVTRLVFLFASKLAYETIVIAAAIINGFTVFAADFTLHSFKKQQLEKYFWSEGAMLGDLNKDGKADAVYGPYW